MAVRGVHEAHTASARRDTLEITLLFLVMDACMHQQGCARCPAVRRTQDMAGDPFGLLLRQRVIFLGGEVPTPAQLFLVCLWRVYAYQTRPLVGSCRSG